MATAGSATGRAAAILTTGEVFGADCAMTAAMSGRVTVDFSLTIGSLTSVTVKAYAGNAATPTDILYVNGVKQQFSLTGDTEAALVFECPGCAVFRLSVQGVGTVTSSTCNFTYRYQDYMTTALTDGTQRID
jgi:hypothetical protein